MTIYVGRDKLGTSGRTQANPIDSFQWFLQERSCLFVSCLIFLSLKSQLNKALLFEYCENEKGNYTTISTYQTILKQVLSILPSTDGKGNGFYTSSYGQNSDEVYAIGLCRGDVDPHVCCSCLNQSTQLLTQTCPNQKEAIGWFDECMLRYSNRSLIGLMETHPKFHSWSTQNSSFIDMDSFSQDVKNLLENLKNGAAAGGSLRKYAAENASVLDQFQNLYAFAQCTPDLSQLDCNNCLDEALEDFQQHNRSVGGRVFTPSCNFRYEVYPFDGHAYDTPPASRLQSAPLSPPAMATDTKASKGKKSSKSRTVISVVVPSVASVVLIISLGVYSRVKKNKANGQKVEGTSPAPSNDEQRRSTMENGGESRRTLNWKKLLQRIVHIRQDLSSNEAAEIG